MPWVTNADGELVFEPETGGGSGSEVNGQFKEINGRSVLVNPRTGDIIKDYGPVGGEGPSQPRRLGNGVFEDEQGLYVEERPQGLASKGALGNVPRKRYITAAEAKQLTNPAAQGGSEQGGSAANATAQGNLAARWSELSLAQQRLDQEILRANQELALAQQKQAFYEEQGIFERGIGNQKIALEKQGLALAQKSQADNLMLSLTGMQQERDMLNVQMQQENDRFNAEMGFAVDQANQRAAGEKADRLQGLATDIGTLAADPGDRGQFAAFALANSGFGQGDQALAEGENLITDESLSPLESLLRGREDVMSSPDNPFSFTPTTAPQLPPLQQQGQVPKVQKPTAQEILAAGGVPTAETASNFEDRPTNQAEQISFMEARGLPDWVVQKAGQMPRMEQGGMAEGAFIAGDSSDGKPNEEVVIPLGPGQAMVIPSDKLTPAMKKQLAKMADGGVFANGIFKGLDTDRTRSRDFLSQSVQNARQGTPFEGGVLPTPVYGSSPGFDPLVAQLLNSLNAQERGLPVAYSQRQQQMLAPQGIRDGVIGRTA